MATKRDIAQMAGVSPATVSNYYNGKGKMSYETEQRIIEAANALNLPLPNKKQTRACSKITFLIVDDLLNPHYGNILQGMNSIASNHDIPVSMIQLWDNVDAFCSMLIASEVYAVYFATFTNRIKAHHIELLRSNGIYVYFSWDNFTIDFDEELVIDGIYPYFTDAKSGYWATKTFLEKKLDFTAIIALNDILAIGAMNALKEAGLSIPEDVSVIGCDDIMLAEFMNPPLTTLRFSAKDIGIRTMYSIIQQEKHQTNNAPVVLQTELIIRKSSGKAPKSESL